MGDFLRVPVVSTPAGFRGPSAGTWAYGPWPSAPDPRLSGEPGVSPPGPPHLGLLKEGTEGSVVRLEGWGPLASGASPWLNWSGRVLQSRSSPGNLAPAPAYCKVGPARVSAWTPVASSGTRGEEKSPQLSRSYLFSG